MNGLRDLLDKRCKRSMAIVLGVKEREVDPLLATSEGKAASAKLRKVVLDQMNELHLFALDVLESLDSGGVVLNEIYLERLDEIHKAVVPDGRRP